MSGKRASMRDGPLAALFRKTEQEGQEPRDEASSAQAPATEPATAAAARASAPAADAPPPPPAEEPRERGVPHPALGGGERRGEGGVPTPQERLRAAFSSELPE